MRILLGLIGVLLLVVVLAVGALKIASIPYVDAAPVFVIEHEVVIEAPAPAVWKVLTDLPSYPEWNPYATYIAGDLVVGGLIDLTIIQSNWTEPMKLTPTIARLDPEHTFGWRGELLFAGVHDTEHYFELHSLGPERTRLRHVEEFRGWLAERIHGPEEKAFTREAFGAMNEALKRRAEQMR